VLWLALTLAQGPDPSVTPVDSAANSILSYVLGYGVLGVAAVLFVLRIIVPRSAVTQARAEARGDLEAELARVLAEKAKAEEQRDEALKVARDQIVPLLSSFTATTGALIPLLQEIVRTREGGHGGRTR
jgi:hypothetical protein